MVHLSPKIILIALLFFTIVGYSYARSRDMFLGPDIVVEAPSGAEALIEPLTEVSGRAERADGLYLNNRQILFDQDGRFNEEVLLTPGYNLIEIKAVDRFDREDKEILELIYEKR